MTTRDWFWLIYLPFGILTLVIRDYRHRTRRGSEGFRLAVVAFWPLYVVLVAIARFTGFVRGVFGKD